LNNWKTVNVLIYFYRQLTNNNHDETGNCAEGGARCIYSKFLQEVSANTTLKLGFEMKGYIDTRAERFIVTNNKKKQAQRSLKVLKI